MFTVEKSKKMVAYSDFFRETQQFKKNFGNQAFYIGRLEPELAKSIEAHGIKLLSLDIVQRGKDIGHTIRASKGNKIENAWWENLPEHLKKADAVFFDTTKKSDPVLLLVFKDKNGQVKKLIIQFNRRLKGGEFANIVRTGGVVDPTGINGKNFKLLQGTRFWESEKGSEKK